MATHNSLTCASRPLLLTRPHRTCFSFRRRQHPTHINDGCSRLGRRLCPWHYRKEWIEYFWQPVLLGTRQGRHKTSRTFENVFRELGRPRIVQFRFSIESALIYLRFRNSRVSSGRSLRNRSMGFWKQSLPLPVMGYNRSNTSPWLKRFLFRADELVRNVQKQISLR